MFLRGVVNGAIGDLGASDPSESEGGDGGKAGDSAKHGDLRRTVREGFIL
jgi:hypothetical protein